LTDVENEALRRSEAMGELN